MKLKKSIFIFFILIGALFINTPTTRAITITEIQVDFGTNVSPVQAGWTQFGATNEYSEARGYGWDAAVGEIDRGAGSGGALDDLEQDFHYLGGAAATRTISFHVDVDSYDWTLYYGDTYSHGPWDLYVNGVYHSTHSNTPSEWTSVSDTTNCAGGWLNFTWMNVASGCIWNGIEFEVHLEESTTSSFASTTVTTTYQTTRTSTSLDSYITTLSSTYSSTLYSTTSMTSATTISTTLVSEDITISVDETVIISEDEIIVAATVWSTVTVSDTTTTFTECTTTTETTETVCETTYETECVTTTETEITTETDVTTETILATTTSTATDTDTTTITTETECTTTIETTVTECATTETTDTACTTTTETTETQCTTTITAVGVPRRGGTTLIMVAILLVAIVVGMYKILKK